MATPGGAVNSLPLDRKNDTWQGSVPSQVPVPSFRLREQLTMTGMLYYTVAGVVLYFLSDWILDRMERARGTRFPNRSLIFFVIILLLSLGSFQLLQSLLSVPVPPAPVTSG